MPRVGFEPTTPVFERAKKVHTLERGVPVIVLIFFNCIVGGGVQTGSTRHVGHFNLGLLYLPQVIVRMENFVE
jgi:hypothetical protein